MDIADLKIKSVGELHDLAEELEISNFRGIRRQDLTFRIEQKLFGVKIFTCTS